MPLRSKRFGCNITFPQYHVHHNLSAMPLCNFLQHIVNDDANAASVEEQQSEADVSTARASRVKRQLQTVPARVAAARAQEKRKHGAMHAEKLDYGQRLQRDHFSLQYQRASNEQTSADPSSDHFIETRRRFTRERARCVWSFLKVISGALRSLLSPTRNIHHICNTCVADDTNTRLRGQGFERSVVYTVMNTVNAVYIRYDDDANLSTCEWESLFLPTPMQTLPTAAAPSLHSAFTSWLVASASGLGAMWQRFQQFVGQREVANLRHDR